MNRHKFAFHHATEDTAFLTFLSADYFLLMNKYY